jgi:hypothetical protein
MPYVARLKDNKYVVYKKKADGTPGERVGTTAGNKPALKRYLAALHMNENTMNEWRKPKVEDLVHDMKVKIRRGRFAGATGIIHDFQLTDSGELVDDQIDILVDKPKRPFAYLGLDDILIERAVRENDELGVKPHEGSMAKSDTYLAAHYAAALHKIIQRDIDLPEWIESKITLAKDYLQTCAEYMYTELKGISEDISADQDNLAKMKKKIADEEQKAAELAAKIAKQKAANAKKGF